MPSLFSDNDGPVLPNFTTLLVKGAYPTFACLNLALSFQDREVIILSSCGRESSGNSLRTSLQGQKATGRISALAEKVRVFYPPTAAHMALLLSAFQIIDIDRLKPYSDAHGTNIATPVYSHLLKPPGPGLVIIHELSVYFATDSNQLSSPSSSYLSILARAISLSSRLGASFALFDTQIAQLKMPVYPDPNPHLQRMQEIAPLLANYIELTVDFEPGLESDVGRITWNIHREHVVEDSTDAH